jgi:hypothetical protein
LQRIAFTMKIKPGTQPEGFDYLLACRYLFGQSPGSLHDGDVLHVLMVSHFVLDRMRLNNQITLSRFRLQNDTISEVTKRERDDMQQKQQDEDELDQNADSLSLYDRYGQAIFVYARLHVPSREDAEDVTLEVFTAALENDNFSGLQEGEKLAWLFLLNQGYRVTGDSFLAAGEAEAVGGGSLYAYLLRIKAQVFCKVGAHGLYVRSQFGLFGDDGCIDVVYGVLVLT